MRLIHGIVLVGLGFALLGCSSSGSSGGTTVDDRDWYDPGPILKERIQERISQLPMQKDDERTYNMQWLSQQGEAAIPFLLEALKNENPKMRSNVAWILGDIGDARVLPELRVASQDVNMIVRLEAARSMMLLGDVKALPELIAGLDADSIFVRHSCIAALHEATGKDFGYDHRLKTAAERREAIARWQSWWQEREDEGWFQEGQPIPPQGVPAAPTGR